MDSLIAQQCDIKEEINPLNDSLCWTIGTKDHLEFIVDKNAPGRNWISITVLSPGKLSSSIGDSAWLLLDNNYVIRLSSSKNFRSSTETLKALYVEIDYYYIRFLSEIESNDIKRMVTNKVQKISFNLHPIFNLNYEISRVKKHPFIPKTSTYTLMDGHVAVRINKITQRQQKDILNTAACADKYVQ
jgi:hypothetical protein